MGGGAHPAGAGARTFAEYARSGGRRAPAWERVRRAQPPVWHSAHPAALSSPPPPTQARRRALVHIAPCLCIAARRAPAPGGALAGGRDAVSRAHTLRPRPAAYPRGPAPARPPRCRLDTMSAFDAAVGAARSALEAVVADAEAGAHAAAPAAAHALEAAWRARAYAGARTATGGSRVAVARARRRRAAAAA